MTDFRRIAVLLALLAIPLGEASAATKVFDITARRFMFEITPSPFAVTQGDAVTLNITAEDDGQGFGHGFFLEHYAENQNPLQPGSPITIQFTADLPGTFALFCTIVCGTEHHLMNGQFNVVASGPQLPTIVSFTPSSGSTIGGETVVVTGTNFQSGASVEFDSIPSLGTSFVAPNRLETVAPPHAAGSIVIKVTNPDNNSVTSSDLYTYEAPGLSVSGITPSSGPTAGGTVVTIRGAGFSSATGLTVSFGGVSSGTVHVVDEVTLTAIAPAHAAARVDVAVSAANGTATLTGAFTYQAATRRRSVRK